MYVYNSMNWGKTTSNTNTLNADEINVDNLTATTGQITTINSLNGNIYDVDSHLLSAFSANLENVNSATGNIQTVNSTNVYTQVINTSNGATFQSGIKTSTGGAVFQYDKNSWTPTVKVLVASGFVPATIIYDWQYGTYIRNGSMVTVFFDVKFGIQDTGADKFLAIGGLPFRISNDANGQTQSTETLTTSSFPNGFAGTIPVIGFPTYPYPYLVSAYEQGASVNLSIDLPPVPVSYGDWTADGNHLVVYANNTLYTPVLTPPFFAEAGSNENVLSTFHIGTGVFYGDCRFAGSISYFTDQ